MSKSAEKPKQPGLAERGSRFLRNLNIIGAVALTGAAVLFPAYSAPLLTLAAIDVAQAGFFEVTRRWSAKRGDPGPKLKPKPA
jgi:hypothetical protein